MTVRCQCPDCIDLEVRASTLLLSTGPNSLATPQERELDRRMLSNALRRWRGEDPLFFDDGTPRQPERTKGGTVPPEPAKILHSAP